MPNINWSSVSMGALTMVMKCNVILAKLNMTIWNCHLYRSKAMACQQFHMLQADQN